METLKENNRRLSISELRESRLKLVCKPLSFSLDLTGRCSLRCRHCGYRKNGRTSDQEMPEEIYGKVVDEILPTAYLCRLAGSNYGEVTISPLFHRAIKDCSRNGVKINLTTNGTFVSDEWLEDLAKAAATIGLSMEGMEEQYELIRGFKWERFLDNCSKIVLARVRHRCVIQNGVAILRSL